MARSASVVAIGALMAIVNVADAQTLLIAPQWTAKLYTAPPTTDLGSSTKITDEYIVYSADKLAGKYAFQDHAGGFVHTKVWSNGQKTSWSNLDPQLVATTDLTQGLDPEHITSAVIADLQALQNEYIAPHFCSFKAEEPETITAVKFQYIAEGKAYYSFYDGATQSTYVEDAVTKKPLQIGDWHIGEYTMGVDPAVFQIHPNCFSEPQIASETYVDVEQDASDSDAPSSLDPSQCGVQPAAANWHPTDAEVGDETFHSNGVKFDNNYKGLGGYGLPSNRLWGTVWCGYGNEFHVKARFKLRDCKTETNSERDSNAACKGKNSVTFVKEKFGCIGEPALDNNEWANDVFEKNEVSFRHWYPRHQYGCGSKCIKLQKKKGVNDFENTFNYIMNSGSVPKSVSQYSIRTDGLGTRNDPKYYDFSTITLPNSGPNAMKLSRCRSVANYIDTDYRAWTSGLVAGAWTDWGTNDTINDWTGENMGSFHRHKDVAFEAGTVGWNSEDWCRQHDWCPLGQGETLLSCACDGAAYHLIQSDPANKHPFKGFPQKLFSNNEAGVHACFNLRLECFWGGLTCKDYRIHWEQKGWRKYNPSPREGFKLWGPIARNDIGKENVCVSLRLPGEGIDGPHATPVPQIGDGHCDCQYNNDLWGFDGGDCCKDTCVGLGCAALNGSECLQPGCFTYGADGSKSKVGPYPVFNARYVDDACPGPLGNKPCFELPSTGGSTGAGKAAVQQN